MTSVSVRQRLPVDLAWILGAAVALFAAQVVVSVGVGYDSHAYWLAGQTSDVYGREPNTRDAFLYSPVFLQLLWPLLQLPWPVFAAVSVVLPALAFAWLLRPMSWRWGVPLWLAMLPETVNGNIFWLLAVVAAVGLQRPGAWAIAALTKITVCLGPIWFVARREWANLTRSLLVLALIVAISAALDPGAWRDWLEFLWQSRDQAGGETTMALLPPLVIRLPLAVALVVFAARTNRRWLIPVAMVLGTPVLFMTAFTMLAAVPRLAAADAQERVEAGGSAKRATRARPVASTA